MEESLGQQYALQVAVQTMKERCLQLQQRLSLVEEENTQLRMKYNSDYLELSDNNTKTEIETLREKVAQLTKQKSQLTHNVLMVATENRHLWNRLSKLTQANQSLGSQLIKLSDSISQGSPVVQVNPTAPNLIRSRTFTHEAPPKIIPKLDKEVYVDTSLEDISLKILNNIAQEKSELEKQCAQMAEIQSNVSLVNNSIGFAYPSDQLDDCDTEFVQHIEKLKFLKEALLIHREKLVNNVELFKKLNETGVFCKSCKRKALEQKNAPKPVQEKPEANKRKTNLEEEYNRICPMCCADYSFAEEHEFVRHVSGHFTTDDPNYLQSDFELV